MRSPFYTAAQIRTGSSQQQLLSHAGNAIISQQAATIGRFVQPGKPQVNEKPKKSTKEADVCCSFGAALACLYHRANADFPERPPMKAFIGILHDDP